MAKKISDYVVKSNALIGASYKLQLNEQRLLDLALADLTDYDECMKKVTTLPNVVNIRAEDYAKQYGVSMNAAYTALKEASEHLFFRYFTYKVESELYPNHEEFRKARWVQEIGYVEGKGVVMLSFTDTLVELAGRLSSRFSSYYLDQKAHLTSMYAHRLYEMMMLWQGDKKELTITLYELRDRFVIEKKQYARPTNFKARVLDPAIKQINERTDLIVSYEQIKEGREIVGFTFTTKLKKPTKPILKDVNQIKDANKIVINDKPVTKPIIQKIPHMTEKQRNTFAFKLLKNFDFIRDFSAETYGKESKDLVMWLEKELEDEAKRQKMAKYLLMVGYEFPEHMKK